MTDEKLPLLPPELEEYLGKPYGGLFGTGVNARVVEQVVADPYRDYRPKDLMELEKASAPAIRKALADLTRLGLLVKDRSDRQHPVYRVNLSSKKLVALTLLAYASLDDRDGCNCMDEAVLEYCRTDLREALQPLVVVTESEFPSIGTTAGDAGRPSGAKARRRRSGKARTAEA
jgi:hypothetical protein